MTVVPEEDFTELVDADIPRVDVVSTAANGTRFLIAKSAADEPSRGLFDPEYVRGLIAKSTPTKQQQETVTMTGSLAAIAAVIHGAPVRKADDLDVTTVLADPEGSPDGNVDEPGSPAWEAVDAATARKWTAILARACNALCTLADREMLEAVAGDGDDAGKAFDLEDAKCAIDYAIGILAPFAVGEQAAADTADAATVAKALAGFDADALDTVEALAPVVKAGRVLSAPNEAAIRAAVDSLQRVLSSLPAAPTDDGQPVAKATKETAMSATATVQVPIGEGEYVLSAPAVEAVAKAKGPKAAKVKKPKKAKADGDVAKAKGGAMFVVCNADGTPVGVCDPDDILPIADGPTADDGDDGDQAPVAPAAAPAEDAAVIPGTQTIAAPAATDDTVTKAEQAGPPAWLTEAFAPFAEQLAQNAQLAGVVKGLQERVEHLAKMPDDRMSPLLNGATGAGAGIASRDGATADDFADLRKAVDQAPTDPARRQAEADLFYAMTKQRFGG